MSIKNLTDAQLQSELKLLPKTSLCREFILQEMGSRVAAEIAGITYVSCQIVNSSSIEHVYVGGDLTGTIKAKSGGFVYQPRGSDIVGETFTSIEAVKASLEAK